MRVNEYVKLEPLTMGLSYSPNYSVVPLPPLFFYNGPGEPGVSERPLRVLAG